jgi:hypothetical protein
MGEEQGNTKAELIAEQLRHAIDLLRAELELMRQAQDHDREMARQRLKALEEEARDHENRIRTATDGVTQFKMWSGLASGGSWLVSLAALLRAWLGG